MEKEFYIVQALRWNKPIRNAICSIAGIDYRTDSPDYLLAEFQGEENLSILASRLGCSPDNVFLYLWEVLTKQIGISASRKPKVLTPKSISLFLKDRFLEPISIALGCSNSFSEIIKLLFDETAMKDLMIAAGIAKADEDTGIDKLFWRIETGNGRKLLSDHFGGTMDIWSILSGLVRDHAIKKLCQYLDCNAEDIFGVLAARVESAGSEEDKINELSDETQIMDMLGVAKLRELLKAISNTYFQRAKQSAESLGQKPLAELVSKILLTSLEFHGRKRYRSGLLFISFPTQTIKSFSIEDKIERKSIQKYTPKIELRAKVIEESLTHHVVIEYRLDINAAWQILLRFPCAQSETSTHIKLNLPRTAESIKGNDDDDLCDTVLNHHIPALTEVERAIWAQWIKDDYSLIQYFVLGQFHLPDMFSLMETLKTTGIDKFDVSDTYKTICPSPQELLERILSQYKRNNISPKLV